MKKYKIDLQGPGSSKSRLQKEFNPINPDSISGNLKLILSIDSGSRVLFGYAEQFPTTLDIE